MAKINMSTGPIIQFSTKDRESTFVSLNTLPIFSYLTLASGGYIIRINPIASGIFVVPLEKELIMVAEDGTRYPIPIPTAIARNIHKVR